MFFSKVGAAHMLFIWQGDPNALFWRWSSFLKTESIIRSLGEAKLLRSKLARGGSWRYLCSPLRFLGSLAAGATVMINCTASEPSICTSCCPDKIFLVQYLQRVRRCPSELHLIEIKLSLERKEESQLKISFQTYFVF